MKKILLIILYLLLITSVTYAIGGYGIIDFRPDPPKSVSISINV